MSKRQKMSDEEFYTFDNSNSDNSFDGEMGSENEDFDFDDDDDETQDSLKNDQNSGGLDYPFEVLSQEKIAEDMTTSIKEVNNVTKIAPSK